MQSLIYERSPALQTNTFCKTEDFCRSVECSDSEKNMSACVDQNHALSLMCVRLELVCDTYFVI